MIDYLLHIHRKGSEPFRTLSSLPEDEAVRLMEELYVEGSVFWERFKDPRGYLRFRKEVERNLRAAFLAKGGKPVDEHPIYLVVGRPRWMDDVSDEKTLQTTQIITVPLSLIAKERVSFTYPDSMVSALITAEKNPEYYEPDCHGHVFTFSEIMDLIRKRGLPGEGWETRMPRHYAHYIEAQLWDRKILTDHFPQGNTGPDPGR